MPTPADPPAGVGNGEPQFGSLTPTETACPWVPAPTWSWASAVSALDELEIELEDMIPGDYGVIIGEANRGTITVTLGGRGDIKFDSNPNDPGEVLLDFNPVGQAVAIIDASGAVVFSGNVPAAASIPAATAAAEPMTTAATAGTTIPGSAALPAARSSRWRAISPEAEAHAEVQFGIAGAAALEVEVEEIPAGDYDLVVGGTVRGTITVVDEGDRLRGKIRFETAPNDSQLPLDFIASGQTLEIRQGDTVFFSGVTPDAPAAP